MLTGQELGNKSRARLALEVIHLLRRLQFQVGTTPYLIRFCIEQHWQWVLFQTQESQRHQTDEVTNSDKCRFRCKWGIDEVVNAKN